MSDEQPRVPCAVIGTGDMGSALASALLGAGHQVAVWNRSPHRYAPLVELGARPAESPAAALRAGELIIVCLLDHITTENVLALDGSSEAISGRTLLQYSFSNGREAAALERWVTGHGGSYLHGQIKAYPREIGTPAARLNYSGTESIFQRFRPTLEILGRPFYLGSDIHAACVVSNTSTILYGCFVAAFFEAAAYAVAEGAELESVVAMLPSATRLAETTITHSAEQLAAGRLSGDQASIHTHVGAMATCVGAMSQGTHRVPRLAQAALDYLQEAQRSGFGSLEIAALFPMLRESLHGPGEAPQASPGCTAVHKLP